MKTIKNLSPHFPMMEGIIWRERVTANPRDFLLVLSFLFCLNFTFSQEVLSSERNESTETEIYGSVPIETLKLNREANRLLNSLRETLKDPINDMKFREDFGPALVEKASILCSSLDLKQLLIGDERTDAVQIFDVEEAKNFISLLSGALNELAQ